MKQESTREKVYAIIREAIISGKLKTGQRITEIQLSDDFHVSRAIVREALQQLAHEGLVEQNSYKGTRVVQLSAEQVDEIISLRLLLEAEAVRQAKRRLTEADKRQLKAMVGKLESSRANPTLYRELDLGLHEKIWELSGNGTLGKLLTQVTVPLFAMATITSSTKFIRASQSRDDHQPSDHTTLVEKLCDGTSAEAVEAMQSHIERNWKNIRQFFAEFVKIEQAGRPAAKTQKRRAA